MFCNVRATVYLPNTRFYSSNKTNAPNDVKFKQKQKFKSKVLLWLILPSESVSQPYIGTTKGVAINTNVYVRKYVSKLLPFIKTRHQHDEYNFWSGFTSSHYANITIDWLKERKINFVPRSVNSPKSGRSKTSGRSWHRRFTVEAGKP